jgi:hypothetical protein
MVRENNFMVMLCKDAVFFAKGDIVVGVGLLPIKNGKSLIFLATKFANDYSMTKTGFGMEYRILQIHIKGLTVLY